MRGCLHQLRSDTVRLDLMLNVSFVTGKRTETPSLNLDCSMRQEGIRNSFPPALRSQYGPGPQTAIYPWREADFGASKVRKLKMIIMINLTYLLRPM